MLKRFYNYPLIVVFLLFSNLLMAQYKSISGLVMDAVTKEPIPYAAIGVKGGYQGTATNVEGAFEILLNCVDTCQVEFTCIGYRTKTLPVGAISDTIWLKPAMKLLKEIVVYSKNVDEAAIVKKALQSVKRNYITKPFVMKGFYRHYCKDSTAYIRLIEAAFDLYKPRGYKRPIMKGSVFKGQLKLEAMRRAFNQYDNGSHPPSVIKPALVSDMVGCKGFVYPQYRESSYSKVDFSIPYELLNDYTFSLNQITHFGEQKVYVIEFHKVLHELKTHDFRVEHTGKLYITLKDHVILKYESELSHNSDKFNFFRGTTTVDYKKFGDKYALFHIVRERQMGWNHTDHVEILNNEIQLGKSKEEYGNDITREDMAGMNIIRNFGKVIPS